MDKNINQPSQKWLAVYINGNVLSVQPEKYFDTKEEAEQSTVVGSRRGSCIGIFPFTVPAERPAEAPASSGHTPGPWTASFSEANDLWNIRGCNDQIFVAEVPAFDTHEATKANAELIARAPMMEKELQAMTADRNFYKFHAEDLQTKFDKVRGIANESLTDGKTLLEHNATLSKELQEAKADLIVAHSAIQTHLRHKEDLQDKLKALEMADSIMLSEKDKKIENLKSVMVAAAEEIQEHWEAHCDKEGYGPANLMHRLKKGLAAEYCGYKPGAFLEMANELSQANEQLQEAIAALQTLVEPESGKMWVEYAAVIKKSDQKKILAALSTNLKK